MNNTQNMKNAPIGVLDSGVGGISVLKELVRILPGEDFLYYGDSANAPYGTKKVEDVIGFVTEISRFLLEKGAKALVVACNTATSVAIPVLRETWKEVPIIGIEPALKPAVLSKENPKVLVMATPMTLEQEKFNTMMHRYEEMADIIKVPCPGLVEKIEEGILEGEEIDTYLNEKFAPYNKKKIDAVVLGCTHYPLIRKAVEKALPYSAVFDGGEGTAKQTKNRLTEAGLLSEKKSDGNITFFNSTGDEKLLSLCKTLLNR